jgi:alkanesulfonate monooxygenase SsuD/methylene tetrahydromethanopterin reductase-like flavin-dependent oxidoreductase (luciferase family)
MPARTTNPMTNANRFKLGLFSINADGGTAFTKVANRWRADWSEIERLAHIADMAGLEFILPIARWKGYGGETNVRGSSFETLTHAAALAAITRHIAIFSTVHVPLVHPVFAAKALTTVDHVSRGRAGLNIVCGWNQEEFDMFGHRQSEHDDRYKQGFEWLSIVLRIFTEDAPFDHEGEFYKLKQVIGGPVPVQRPRPVTLSAAFSPAGRRFAAATSDFLFTSLRSFETAKPHIAEIRRLAAETGRDVRLLTTTHVVCRETDTEARQYYDHYASDMADAAAVDIHQRKKDAHYGAVEPDAVKLERRRYAGGTGSFPLIGSPQTIAEKIFEIGKLGFAGATLSFVNFNEELPFFVDRVLPLLQQAGLREDDPRTGDAPSPVVSGRLVAVEPSRTGSMS